MGEGMVSLAGRASLRLGLAAPTRIVILEEAPDLDSAGPVSRRCQAGCVGGGVVGCAGLVLSAGAVVVGAPGGVCGGCWWWCAVGAFW